MHRVPRALQPTDTGLKGRIQDGGAGLVEVNPDGSPLTPDRAGSVHAPPFSAQPVHQFGPCMAFAEARSKDAGSRQIRRVSEDLMSRACDSFRSIAARGEDVKSLCFGVLGEVSGHLRTRSRW